MKNTSTYNEKILGTLADYMILKMLNTSTRHISTGMTGKEIITRLRAYGLKINQSTIYAMFGRLRRNGLITKGRIETDYMSTEIAYYISKAGEKYLSSTKEFLESILKIQ